MSDNRQTIRISVRNLVEYVLRTGDIDNRRKGSRKDEEAMLMGSRMHRTILSAYPKGYASEVALKLCIKEKDYDFVLEGRADGIFVEDGITYIDEIKGVFRDLDNIEEPDPVHLAQAMCYAYMISQNEKLKNVGVTMTYANLETNDLKYFRSEYTDKELNKWFKKLYKEYKKWIELSNKAKKELSDTGRELDFPFEYREGQSDLVKDVYRSILRRKNLFIEAPTGVGKTISTIFPSVKALSFNLGEKIFYLTSKTVIRKAASDAFDTLIDRGLSIRIVTLTAKEKVCFMERMECNPIECPYAKGYYDRVNDAVYEMLKTCGNYDREKIIAFAKERNLCPFEFSLDLSLWCDAIICDYNYVFDPNVYLRRFFEDRIDSDYIFLVDEAHNMVDRGRKMYSASIVKEDVLTYKRYMVSEDFPVMVKALDSLNNVLLRLKRECDDVKIQESISAVHIAVMRAVSAMDIVYKIKPSFKPAKDFDEFMLNLRHFNNMAEIADDDYIAYTEHDEKGNFVYNLFCVETARVLQQREYLARSSVFFSATMLPINYYKHMLTEKKAPYAIYAKSSFDDDKKRILIGKDVSSKYTRRNKEEYRRFATYIEEAFNAKRGNYLVFFPSYKMLNDIYGEIEDSDVLDRIVIQGNDMNEEEREEFISNFTDNSENIGFCVMGGVFSEGIDLTGDRLIGVIIVGTGLPQVSHEREILKIYYDNKDINGFDYSYLYPGMNKVCQAAGRLIRTSMDCGVILLLDVRFTEKQYLELFPNEWTNRDIVTVQNVAEKVKDFWDNCK